MRNSVKKLNFASHQMLAHCTAPLSQQIPKAEVLTGHQDIGHTLVFLLKYVGCSVRTHVIHHLVL